MTARRPGTARAQEAGHPPGAQHCAPALDRALRVGEALRDRPAGEDLRAAVRAAVLEVYAVASTAPDPRLIAGIRLVTSSPDLRGEYLKTLSMMQYGLAGAITERAGGDPAADTFAARALAAAVTAVIQAATERWLFSDPPVPLAPVIEAGLAELVSGLRAVRPAGPALVASLRAAWPPGCAGSGQADAPGENQAPPVDPSG